MVEHDELPAALREMTRLLREPVAPPSDVWRHRLLKAVSETRIEASTERTGRRWSVRPLHAIAAGLVCKLVGGASVALLLRASVNPPARVAVQQTPPAGTSRVRFTIVAPGAARVSVVGDFNGWDPTALPLQRAGDGRTWIVEVPLPPGRYAYSFVVDGALARDPSAPQARDDDYGSSNSIVMVRGS